MEFTELTIKLLLIFFPGIIAALIIDTLTVHKERDFKVFILNSFILGFTSYFILYIAVSINNWIVKYKNLTPTWEMNFLNSSMDTEMNINTNEVLVATLLSIIIAIIFSACINHRLLFRIGSQMGISRKFGQLDVWSYTFESPDIGWIIVRDLNKDLMYQGWVEAFSDTHEQNELLLREVNVYRNSSAEELYYMEGIYITGEASNLIVEIPKVESSESLRKEEEVQ